MQRNSREEDCGKQLPIFMFLKCEVSRWQYPGAVGLCTVVVLIVSRSFSSEHAHPMFLASALVASCNSEVLNFQVCQNDQQGSCGGRGWKSTSLAQTCMRAMINISYPSPPSIAQTGSRTYLHIAFKHLSHAAVTNSVSKKLFLQSFAFNTRWYHYSSLASSNSQSHCRK